MGKGNRNRNQRPNGSRQPPPMAGAVDLDALRRRPEGAERLAEAEREVIARQGLICPCGERVRGEGVEYMAVVTQTVPTPAGPQATVGLGSTTFHSGECPLLVQVLEHVGDDRGQDDPKPLVLRAAPAVVWLDELMKGASA